MHNGVPDSFDDHDARVGTAPNGGRGRVEAIEQAKRFERRVIAVGDHVWCVIGNGLSNQTFVEGPDGLIVIDTGDSLQEMQWALDAVREHTDAPIAAAIYSHFHYVGGTQVLFDAGAPADIPIWSHAGVVDNRRRQAGEVGPVSRYGLVHQFGMLLPADGADALISAGTGPAFRLDEHAPFTEGFVEPTDTFDEPVTTQLAGLTVEMTPAVSDSDDSITIWFPELSVAVNNLMWPALFNVFAIRGEEYRDPRVLLAGFDHLISLDSEHLVGTHGPPISGGDHIRTELTRSRDAIQFFWDQTVRGVNLGLTHTELIEFVQLEPPDDASYFQAQFYGLVEHHTRQIHTGLRGWFDGDAAQLFPVPRNERASKLIAGFGGADRVRAQFDDAITTGDLRWAVELASWLVDDGCDDADRRRLATALRKIGQQTTSANIRNWCLTQALAHEDQVHLDRFRVHRFGRGQIATASADDLVHIIRVMLDPQRCAGAEVHLRVELPDGAAGLHIRHRVAVPTDGDGADAVVTIDRSAWGDYVNGKRTIEEIVAAGDATADSLAAEALSWFAIGEHEWRKDHIND